MSNFLANLRGPLALILDELPTSTAELVKLGIEIRERIEAAREKANAPMQTMLKN